MAEQDRTIALALARDGVETGDGLRFLREATGFPVADLATLLQVRATTLEELEGGSRPLDRSLTAILRVLVQEKSEERSALRGQLQSMPGSESPGAHLPDALRLVGEDLLDRFRGFGNRSAESYPEILAPLAPAIAVLSVRRPGFPHVNTPSPGVELRLKLRSPLLSDDLRAALTMQAGAAPELSIVETALRSQRENFAAAASRLADLVRSAIEAKRGG